jgi:hypothetical protein
MAKDSDQPEYAAISPPSDKPRANYSYVERRAELYRYLKRYGHPRNMEVNQTELASRYDVDQSTISHDFQRLQEYYRERAGDKTVAQTTMLGEKVIEEHTKTARELGEKAEKLEAAGDIRAAGKMREKAADMWAQAQDKRLEFNEFLFDVGELDEEPDRVEIDMDPDEAYMQALKQTSGVDDE